MELLELEMESLKALSERKVLFALSLSGEKKGCTYTELLQATLISRPTLSARLDDLEKQGFITRTAIIEEKQWPPSVYYKLTAKGHAEFIRRHIIAYIATSEVKVEKFDRESEFYIYLLNTFRENLTKRELDRGWLKSRLNRVLGYLPDWLRERLLGEDKEAEVEINAMINAYLVTQCLDIFVYSDKPFNWPDWFWYHTYEWLCKVFEENMDAPEDIGNHVVAVMFNGDKARQLKTKPREILESEAFTCYMDHLLSLDKKWKTWRETYEEKLKHRPPKPSCFKDLKKLSEDTPWPEHCRKCDWVFECSGVL